MASRTPRTPVVSRHRRGGCDVSPDGRCGVLLRLQAGWARAVTARPWPTSSESTCGWRRARRSSEAASTLPRPRQSEAAPGHAMTVSGRTTMSADREEVSWCVVVRERVAQLLGRPCRGRMLGDRQVNGQPTAVRDDDEHEEPPEGDRRDDEQVGGHDLAGVIGQERSQVCDGGRRCWRRYVATWCRSAMTSRCSDTRDRMRKRLEWSSETRTDATRGG
jgi:hypothetical protein